MRFDIMKKRLISSYDEENDTFVGKVDGGHGYYADYGICDGVYLGIDNSNLPTSIYISDASHLFNIPKAVLESANVKIGISCSSTCLSFCMTVEDLLIFSTKCKNSFGIPNIKYEMDSNI